MNAMDQEDEFLSKLFRDSEERPHADLTEKVMHRIDQRSKIFEYEPVIGNRTWMILGSIFSLTIAYLMLESGGVTFRTPELLQLVGEFFSDLSDTFSFKITTPTIPEIPATLLISIGAINIVGIYLMVSFRWLKGLFQS